MRPSAQARPAGVGRGRPNPESRGPQGWARAPSAVSALSLDLGLEECRGDA